MSEGIPHESPGGEEANAAASDWRVLTREEDLALPADPADDPEPESMRIDGKRLAEEFAALGDVLNEQLNHHAQQLFAGFASTDLLTEQAVERITQLAAIWGKQSREIARRNRDRAQKYIAPDHVAAALPRIDWHAFIDLRHGRRDPGAGPGADEPAHLLALFRVVHGDQHTGNRCMIDQARWSMAATIMIVWTGGAEMVAGRVKTETMSKASVAIPDHQLFGRRS